jgi:hypothetical protein
MLTQNTYIADLYVSKRNVRSLSHLEVETLEANTTTVRYRVIYCVLIKVCLGVKFVSSQI